MIGMAAKPLPYIRWTLLALLLLGEILFLTWRFDAGSLVAQHQWWAQCLIRARLIPQFAVAIGAATLVFGGPRLSEELKEISQAAMRPHSLWHFLLLHLLAFLLFLQLTKIVLEGNLQEVKEPGFWVLLWALGGLATGLLWAGAVLPWKLWREAAINGAGIVAVAGMLGVAAWGAGQYTVELWNPLSGATLWLVHELMIPLFDDIIWIPEQCIAGAGSFSVEIAYQCSGYEGIGLIWIFLVFFLWFDRQELHFPHAFLLLPLGTIVIWLANSMRIVALIAVGTRNRHLALAGFHSEAGWLIFNGVALGCIVLARRWPFFSRLHCTQTVSGGGNATLAFLGPLFMTLGTGMIIRAITAHADVYYPILVLASVFLLWCFRRHYVALGWELSWAAVNIGVIGFGVWMALARYGVSPVAEHPVTWQDQKNLLASWFETWLVFRILGYVLIVPLVEELAFRAYLTRRLIARDFQEVPMGKFAWLSFLGSSLLFGALHSSWAAGTAVGMLYALALYRRGKIADPVVGHIITNLLVFIYVLMTQDLATLK
jgi:exosortase E/protease (VPEID-CTERM system)